MHRAQQIIEALFASLVAEGLNVFVMSSFKPDSTSINLSWGELSPLDPQNQQRIVWQMTLVADIYVIEIEPGAIFEMFDQHARLHRVVMDEQNSYPGVTFLHGVWPQELAEPEFSPEPDVSVPTMRVAYRIDFHTSYADVEA